MNDRQPFSGERPKQVDGVYHDLDYTIYHRSHGLSSGAMKKLVRSPAHYRAHVSTPDKDSDSRRFGRAAHLGILEPARAESLVIPIPEDAPKRPTSVQRSAAKPSAGTLDSIRFWDEFDRTARGKIPLSQADFDLVFGCVAAVRDSRSAMNLLSQGRSEVSAWATDPETGIQIKARMDYWRLDANDLGIVDLKTCDDASKDGYPMYIGKHDYDLQGAHYRHVGQVVTERDVRFFAHIAVETTPPHGVGIYLFDDATMLYGWHRCQDAYRAYSQARAANEWPCYPDEVSTIGLPGWKMRRSV